MTEIPLGILFLILFILLLLSAFFSSSETSLLSLNRYRLRHLAREKHPGAIKAQALLDRPDRLIGLILIGNNFVNIAASAVATIIGLRMFGEVGIAIATGVLTLLILIFSEVAPKTLAALYPERIAFPVSHVHHFLIKILYPLVWLINLLANSFLRLLGVVTQVTGKTALGREELRSLLLETQRLKPRLEHNMLLGLLDLESVTVKDIMVPRNKIIGLDIDQEDFTEVSQQVLQSPYTRLPVYRQHIDNIIGFVHIRNLIPLIAKGEFNSEQLLKVVRDAAFVPENTPLQRQLLAFQKEKRRIALVVDEYGDIRGLVTLEDILEEVVGEFTTDPANSQSLIQWQADGSVLVSAGIAVRQCNRLLNLNLPLDGPRTLNGLILEQLETLPPIGQVLELQKHRLEIIELQTNAIKTVRIWPAVTDKG